MSTFSLYFELGRDHILNVIALDHMLFVIALCVVYKFNDWSKVFMLVTAFTIGHSLTLVLATFGALKVDSALVESLIPITILITSVRNVSKAMSVERDQKIVVNNYLYALFFGLIHGLGFSNYLRSLLGTENSIVTPLFAFNAGIELGQMMIVIGFFVIAFVIEKTLKIERKKWVVGVSGVIGLVSLYLFINTVI